MAFDSATALPLSLSPKPTIQLTLEEHNSTIIASQARPPIVVGLTPLCPYGLGPCWAGAYNALRRINDVEMVAPVPSQKDSLAYVWTHKHNSLPDIDIWRSELAVTANASYEMRGLEVTLRGEVVIREGQGVALRVEGEGGNTLEVSLGRFTMKSQLKWDAGSASPREVSGEETGSYERLVGVVVERGGSVLVKVTGTLQKREGGGFGIDVRKFEEL